MTTKTFYPRRVTQTTGGKYATFENKDVIKATGNGYAQTKLIKSKKSSPNRPSTLTCTDFNMQLPVGCVVNKIVVEYMHMKVSSSGKYANIPAPTVSLLYDGKVMTATAKGGNMERTIKLSNKSKAPITAPDTPHPTWAGKYTETYYTTSSSTIINNNKTSTSGKKTVKMTYSLPTRDKLNSTKFGVQINYPTNTSTNAGYLRVYWVRVKVDYTPSTYTITSKQTYGGTNYDGTLNKNGGYNKDEYRLTATINRKSKTGYIPKVTITLPVGFTYRGFNDIDVFSQSKVVQVAPTILEWTPGLPTQNKTGSNGIELIFDVNVTYATGQTSYDATFTFTEALNQTERIHNVTIIDKPTRPGDEGDDDQEKHVDDQDLKTDSDVIVFARPGENINLNFSLTEAEYNSIPLVPSQQNRKKLYLDIYNQPDFTGNKTLATTIDLDVDTEFTKIGDYYECTSTFYSNQTTEKVLELRDVDDYIYRKLKVGFIPTSLSTPSHTLLTLSEEEKHRLGEETYTVQSYLRKTSTDEYHKNWGNNFRIGVFNNPIEENRSIITYVDEEGVPHELIIDSTNYETLTSEEIYSNAAYWSEPLTKMNEFESHEVQFHYDPEFPIYILITGEYPEGNTNNYIDFTEPCIIETDLYHGYEKNGVFPAPINNLISDENETSELSLPVMAQSNTFILADWPLDPDTSTDETMAIRGVEVTGNIEATDEMVLYATLRAPNGYTGQRTIILQEEDTNSINGFSIGGSYDLWGFGLLDMINMEDWEIQLTIGNSLYEKTSSINFGDLTVALYTESVDSQNVTCKVNNENLAFYGAFLTDITIPPGLETDVDFLTIDGTDTNDAYRQNIKEKTIELEFEIGDTCDLEINTSNLRQITRLLTNTKDKYNRPIPKRIEFSHLPDVYYEYIIKDSLDVELDINTYHVKCKLIIPSGTSFTKQSTTTNIIGYVQGLAAVNPIITVKPTDELIEIRETNTGQKFNIGYSEIWTDKIVEIDCEDRIVWLKNDDEDQDPVNINEYVDWNSDWFSLQGEYSFEGSNCVIRTVDYIERW